MEIQNKPEVAHKLFKINQDAVVRNSEGKILILGRGGKWELPGGRLEEGETPQEGLLREIKEETGIGQCNVENVVDVRLSKSGNTYRVTFLCSTSEESVVLSEEHDEHAWIKKENIENYPFEFEEIRDILKTAG